MSTVRVPSEYRAWAESVVRTRRTYCHTRAYVRTAFRVPNVQPFLPVYCLCAVCVLSVCLSACTDAQTHTHTLGATGRQTDRQIRSCEGCMRLCLSSLACSSLCLCRRVCECSECVRVSVVRVCVYCLYPRRFSWLQSVCMRLFLLLCVPCVS